MILKLLFLNSSPLNQVQYSILKHIIQIIEQLFNYLIILYLNSCSTVNTYLTFFIKIDYNNIKVREKGVLKMIENRCDCKPQNLKIVNKAREKMPDYRDIKLWEIVHVCNF